MAKFTLMSFPKRVRYKHIQYPPNTAFRVADVDVADLAKSGGWIIEESVKKVEPVEEVIEEVIEESVKEKPVAKKAKGVSKKKGE